MEFSDVENANSNTLPLGSNHCRICSNNVATSCGLEPVRCIRRYPLPRFQRASETKERGGSFKYDRIGNNQRSIE
jgi:hypothetical protein